MLLAPRVLQRPRAQKSPKEALRKAREGMRYRNLAFRRDGNQISGKHALNYSTGGLKKNYDSHAVFARPGSSPNTYFFFVCDRKKQLPPP